MPTTTLNSAWFTANPGPPWVLVGDGTTFQLALDLDVPSVNSSGVPGSGANYGGGELFKFSGKNQAFDRNNHYIRINGKDIGQRTRSGDRIAGAESEHESPTQALDNVGNIGTLNWEKPQDTGGHGRSDTGGRVPNTESGTSQGKAEPRGGHTSSGRGGKT